MELVRFGNTGLKVSKICLGAMTYGSPKWRDWVLDEEQSRPFIKAAIEKGINFFDTADVYSLGASDGSAGPGAEGFRAVAGADHRGDESLQPDGADAQRSGPVAQAYPARHRQFPAPPRHGTTSTSTRSIRFDPTTPVEETIDALNDVVKAGKARYIGASSMYAWQFSKYLHLADKRGKTRFVSMQNHYNLVYREEEREMMPLCRAEGIAVIPWSPLARGFLAGNRRRQDKGRNHARQVGRFRPPHVLPGHRFRHGRPGGRDRAEARRAECAGWRSPGCCISPA